MKKIAVILFLIYSILNAFSQNSEAPVDFSRFGTPVTSAMYVNRSITSELIRELERANQSKTPEELNEEILKNIEGTPYLKNEFEKGEIWAVDGTHLTGALLRYNIFNNKMEVLEKEILYELSNDLIKRIKTGERIFDYLSYTIADKENTGYLELIQDGKWILYCRYAKKFTDLQPQKAMQDKPNPASFRDLPEIFLIKKTENQTATGFRNKKELLNIFSPHKVEVQDYIKNQKIMLDNPDDLKKLVSYCTSLYD
jgi:hypothetical protein